MPIKATQPKDVSPTTCRANMAITSCKCDHDSRKYHVLRHHIADTHSGHHGKR